MIRSYSSLLFWLAMTIGASLMLYHTSDKVHALEQQLASLNSQIDDEQKSLHVLKAEWVYLANPARIEAEAKRHTNLQPTPSKRMSGLQQMADLLPSKLDLPARVQVAQAATKPSPSFSAAIVQHPLIAQSKPHTPRDRVLASLNAGRINDHMTMQHAASAQASTDRIGALIGKLGLYP